MRQARAKLKGVAAVYHCITRTVAGEMLLDDVAKEVLRKMIWQVADFSGVEVLAYCVMSNHFHVLVRVSGRKKLSRDELVRRYRVLYAKSRSPYQPDPDVLEGILKGEQDKALAEEWRERLEMRMGDVSEFMKTLKQRFSVWYNRSHHRYGTLWAERFKSVLVEDHPSSLKTLAAYIDLNPVRAGLVEDPGDYRWSTYGEAMGDQVAAQRALAGVFHKEVWSEAVESYRMVLYGKGGDHHQAHQKRIPRDRVVAVLESGGKVPMSSMLRCRVRYFTDGAIIGSKVFVQEKGAMLLGSKQQKDKRLGEIPLIRETEGICVWRSLRLTRFS